jgi:hypothetical protein
MLVHFQRGEETFVPQETGAVGLALGSRWAHIVFDSGGEARHKVVYLRDNLHFLRTTVNI